MKIILLSDVYKHGVAGEVVEVADGFARNYLIPKGLATKANNHAMKQHSKMLEAAEVRRTEYEEMLNDLGRKIDGTALVFFRRAANSGKLFGSVTTQDITEALDEATGVDINRRRISQQGLREVGLHEVPVRLGTDISPILQIRVIREDEQVVYARQMEAVSEGLIPEVAFDENGNIIQQDIAQLRSRLAKQEAEAAAEAEIEEIRDSADEVETVAEVEDDVPPASDYADEDEDA